MDQPSQANGHSTALLIVVSVLCGLLIGIFGFLAWQKLAKSNAPVTPVPIAGEPTPIQPAPTASSTPPVAATSTPSNIDLTAAELSVLWQTGTIVDPNTTFSSLIPSNELRVRSLSGYKGGIDEALPEYKFTYDYYEQGRVTSGPFQGHIVYSAIQTDRIVDLGMDHSESPVFLNFLISPNKNELRIIGMTASSVFSQAWPRAVFAPNLKLNLSTFPDSLTLDNGKTIRRASLSQDVAPQPLCGGPNGCVDRLPLARTSDGRGVYTGPTGSLYRMDHKVKLGCVIIYLENGEGAVYESGIPSAVRDPQVPDDEAGAEITHIAARVVGPTQLKWDVLYANTSTFRAHEVGGCGGIDCLRILNVDEVKVDDLVQAGKTDAGDPIYIFKTQMNRSPHSVVYEVYESWYNYDPATGQKPPVGAFLQQVKVPLFLWKDALGRWVVYKNTITAPLAECGKPVIYLYPTKTQNVSVKLPSFINVTVSDPVYPSEGWNVSAETSGKLTLKDGTVVSSLYWEGLGVNYEVPKTGFVVKDGDVEGFLKTTLVRYGLNAQEAQDFMEFWVPRMTGAPYYRISFLTDDWNKQVPLNVSPAPRTSIRLFMDWQRLSSLIDLPEPQITTPTRDGFTLVEWGGLLR